MVNVNYLGTLGNQLWAYSVGRTIAHKHNLQFRALPIDGFINTNEPVNGHIGQSPVTFTGHKIGNVTNDSLVTLNGNFQRYEYIKHNKDLIKEWFYIEPVEDAPSENELVLTIRRGWNGWPTKLSPPVSFFINFIKNNPQYTTISLCTDTFDDAFFAELNPYIDKFIKRTGIEQFRYIKSANNIMLSPSTFSWWAGFLSDASNIYYPLFSDLIPTPTGVNWVVDDEDRYKIIKVN